MTHFLKAASREAVNTDHTVVVITEVTHLVFKKLKLLFISIPIVKSVTLAYRVNHQQNFARPPAGSSLRVNGP